MTPLSPRPISRPRSASGFTFIEILVVMSMMAVIMGLGIGFLTRVGTSARVQQSASILAEAGFECQNRSAGGRRATLIVDREKDADEDGTERIVVTQSVQRPMLTMHFEDDDWTFSANGPSRAKALGTVRRDDEGWSGSCATLSRGGVIDFGVQAVFAPTDGLEIDVAVKPEKGRGSMVVFRGEDEGTDYYQLLLAKDASTSQDTYRVQLRLALVPADATRRTEVTRTMMTYETHDSPVVAGEWNQIRVSFDGRDAVLSVKGVDHTRIEKRAKDAPPPVTYRLATPPSGGLRATASAERGSFEGSIDLLSASGIFRTDEDRRVLRGDVEVASYRGTTHSARLPIRVVWWNGRLDPSVHGLDEVLEVTSPSEPTRWRVTFGLYGVITPPQRFPGFAPQAADVTPTPK